MTSNFNFWKTLDFNAGDVFGGSYSIYLTSGPISNIGGVIGWNEYADLGISRVYNFYWIVFLQIIFSYLIVKSYDGSFKFLLVFNTLLIVLIPWWQGSLYMIGEIPSVIILINSFFLFNKKRNIALIFISVSIFFGKLLNILPFSIFYIVLFILEKNYKRIAKDLIYFSIPIVLWLGLVNFNYQGGNLQNYIVDLFNLISNHQSSGISRDQNIFSLSNFNTSEASSWNNYELIRILIAPILFFIILFRNKSSVINFFGNILYPLAFSTIGTYIWFWILSPTKWMRYSQHFIVVVLISILYFINFEIIITKIDLFFVLSTLFLYIDNQKSLIVLGISLLFYFLFISKKQYNQSFFAFLLTFMVLTDLFIPFLNTNTQNKLEIKLNNCVDNLVSEYCLLEYEQLND